MNYLDFLDIDEIEVVPDTPERVPDTPERIITSRSYNDGNGNRSNGSSSCRVIDKDCFNQKVRNEAREKGKSSSFDGTRRLFLGDNIGKSSSKNGVSNVENACHDKGKSLSSSHSFVDLTERNRRDHGFGLNNTNNTVKLGPRADSGKGVAFGIQHKGENNMPSSGSTPQKVTRQRKLVKNGCISPQNIAKSKQAAERHDVSSVTNTETNGPSNKVDITELISEPKGSHRFKGKGIEHHNSSLPDRRSMLFKEPTVASKESDGYPTHNTTKQVVPTSVNGDRHIIRGKSASSSAIDQLKIGKTHMDYRNKSTSSSSFNNFEDLEILSDSAQLKESVSKRQREAVGSSNTRGRDVAYVNNNADMATSSSQIRDSSITRSTRNKNSRGAGSSSVDELSREGRNIGSSSNVDLSVRALQLEADERLARELQEQLYNEELSVGFRTDEMDSYDAMAMAFQQDHSLLAGGRPAPRSRSNASRGSSSNRGRGYSSNRGRAQAPSSTRLARLSGRFPGRARTISSVRSSIGSIFPPNMDVDMRMHILETLEAFNDMELPNNFLQVGREFNENDYEMLLALDDNNDQHGGATHAQINNLPQSTVQAENLQECAICLETPNVGETIRHLPCFHKFHKDCIDEWLRRKTSCPVCKSSVT